jgi:hypothetical protein
MQGSTHLERGNNFVAMLQKLPGGMPSTHTLDLIEGVSHQNDQMFNSTQLRQRVSASTSAYSLGKPDSLCLTVQLFKLTTGEPLQTSNDPTTVSGNADGNNSNNSSNNNGNNSSSGSGNSNNASPSALSSGGLLGAATLFAILTIL